MRLDSPATGGPKDAFDAMAYDYGYFYPPYYIQDPWRTTDIPRHFPERHYPLEHFRHTVASGVRTVADPFIHPFGHDPPIFSPSTDVRETKDRYFIDVELPGLDSKEMLKITWTSSRTLLIETKVARPKIDEPEIGGSNAEATSKRDEQPRSDIDNTDDKSTTSNRAVPLIVHERRIGSFARAFSFPVKVDHEKLDATLHAGLLRIKVLKKETEEVHPDHENVEVKHSGA